MAKKRVPKKSARKQPFARLSMTNEDSKFCPLRWPHHDGECLLPRKPSSVGPSDDPIIICERNTVGFPAECPLRKGSVVLTINPPEGMAKRG